MRKAKKNKVKSIWSKYREWYKPILLRAYKPTAKDQKTATPKFATIDIETQDWVNYVCGEVYWVHDGQEYSFETNDIHELMIKCFEIAGEYDITNFVAHYGGKFDFLFFIKDLMLSPYTTVENIMPRGASLLSFDAKLHKTSKRTFNFKIPEKITFRDSSALLPFSLGSLTKSFNVETLKGEMDFLFIEQVYKGQDYLDDILEHTSCVLFFNGKQVRSLTKAHRRKKDELKYWNMERYPISPFRGKISLIKPYMQKRDKKNNVIENNWKKDITYPIFEKKDLLLYLHHDCKSLHQVIEAFFNAPLICSSKKKWTTASQAVEVFRLFMKTTLHSLPDDDIFFHEGDVDGFVRQAYFGGRTEIFKPIFDDEINESDYLYYQDINSLYPYVMSKFEYPDEFLGWIEGEKEYHEHEMAIWHCKVKVPENMYAPPLATKRDDRLIFPVGVFKGYWTKYELEYAKSIGCEVLEYYEGAAFRNAGYIFKEFIETLYRMRLEAKEKNDNVTQMTMKLIMNSCYGRMGINKERSKIIIDDGTYHKVKAIADIDTDFGMIRLAEKPERSRTMFSNPAIACFVTSYARVYLHQCMRDVGETSVYYCDTDSLFTDKPMKLGKELGAMKLEYKCKSACFLLPKTYVNEEIIEEDGKVKPQKLTMKGFDFKNINNVFTMDDFLEYLNGEIGNISVVEKPKFATFKTALRMGEFVTMRNSPEINREVDEWREAEHFKKTGKKKKYLKKEYKVSVKKLQGYYTKRKIIKGGFDTEALRIYE